MGRPSGFKRCTVQIHREHEHAARAALARHAAVVAETIEFSGQHLSFSIDLARCPPDEGGLVAAVIERDVQEARP